MGNLRPPIDRRIDIPTPDLAGLTGIFRTHRRGELADADLRPVALVAGGGTGGTGKTSFASALAREANVHFIATSYGQWQAYKEGHLGHMTPAPPPTGRFHSARAGEEAPLVEGIPLEPGQARK